MYRLWNFLFGWQYVAIRYGYSYELCRVRYLKSNNRAFVWVYGDIYFLDAPPSNVIYLT